MQRTAVLILALVLTASVLVGQQAGVPFWLAPGNTLRDAKGTITYTEIKDPKTFTMKVFDRGRWVTYHYEPNSTKVIKAEAADTTDDYLYDGEQWNGRTVHAHGRVHTIRVTEGLVLADDMPPVTIERDGRGRDSVVRRGTEVVATINYDATGQVRRFTVGAMALDFEKLDGGIREILTANGAPLVTTVAHAEARHQFPVSLDPVADRLGLHSDWRNSAHFSRSTTGSLTTVSDDRSHSVAEIVQLGGMGAAFDTKNAPLFYDLRLNYISTPAKSDAGDAFADVTTLLNGVLPDGLIVPPIGDASAYVSRPRDGAISSVWTGTVSSQPSYRFIVYHEGGAASSTAMRPTRATSADQAVVVGALLRSPRVITPLMMWQCGSEEHWDCDYSGGSAYCYNYYTPVYCDSGGGGYTPPPDDSGGSSSGGTAGNHVTGDSALQVAVNNALNAANNKFSNTRCSHDLFNDTKLTDGTSLADALTQRGTDAATWLQNSLRFINGYANGTCSSVPAWTTVNNTTVTVCTSFKNLGATPGAVVLIHEELHTLGLTERPGYPDAAMDSPQITQLVMNYCGG